MQIEKVSSRGGRGGMDILWNIYILYLKLVCDEYFVFLINMFYYKYNVQYSIFNLPSFTLLDDLVYKTYNNIQL